MYWSNLGKNNTKWKKIQENKINDHIYHEKQLFVSKKKKSGSVVCPQCEHFCQCIFAIHNSTAYKGLGGKIHSS